MSRRPSLCLSLPPHIAMLGRCCLVLGMLASLLLAGCGSAKNFEEEPVKAHLRQVCKAYWSIVGFHRRPPRSLEELKEEIHGLHLLDMGAPVEDALVSPRDQQPFVIILGADAKDPSNAILAYEQKGADNTRWVVEMQGDIKLLTAEQFGKATFAKNHKPTK